MVLEGDNVQFLQDNKHFEEDFSFIGKTFSPGNTSTKFFIDIFNKYCLTVISTSYLLANELKKTTQWILQLYASKNELHFESSKNSSKILTTAIIPSWTPKKHMKIQI